MSGRIQFIRNRDTQTSYNAGLVFTSAQAIRLKVGYGYAFRLPSIAEQFADDVYTAGNADLSPETSRSISATVEYGIPDGRLTARATLFHQTVDSLIQYSYNPVIFRSVPQNVERFRSTGLDLSWGYRLSDLLSVNWSGVYQHARQTADDGATFTQAYYVPEIKWRSDVDFVPTNRLNANINVTYTGDRGIVMYGGLPKTIRKVYEVGMSLTARFNDRLRLRFTGYDLTDQARPDQFGFTLTDRDYPSPGRRFLVNLTYNVL